MGDTQRSPTISTSNQYLDEPLKGYEDVRVGEYSVLSVSDDASGIYAEDLKRIFEPFYTKKTMGRSGTGLGMAVVWGTVKDHRGFIEKRKALDFEFGIFQSGCRRFFFCCFENEIRSPNSADSGGCLDLEFGSLVVQQFNDQESGFSKSHA